MSRRKFEDSQTLMVRNCIIANVLMLCDQPKVQGMIMCVKAYDFQVHIKAGQSWTQDANLPKCFSSLAWLYTNFRLKEDIIVVSKVTDSGDLCVCLLLKAWFLCYLFQILVQWTRGPSFLFPDAAPALWP